MCLDCTYVRTHIHLTVPIGGGGEGAPIAEEFSVDAIEGGRTRRKSKKEILIAKDVDIEKVERLICFTRLGR